TGFVVYTDRTYPEFTRLLARLGVASEVTTMSFSVRDDQRGVEFGTHAMRAMAPRDFFVREPYQILWDALRFRRHARRHLGDPALTVGQYLERGRYSTAFQEYLLLPPCAAVWCADFDTIRAFPFARWYPFLERHGFANVLDPPVWRTVRGGASRYIEPLAAPFAERVRLRTPVVRLERRAAGGVWVATADGAPERFDEVVVATHADQALGLLAEPSERERRVLGAFHYSKNDVVVHHDPAVLPLDRRKWSAWNYWLEHPQRPVVTVTYLMNVLHRFESDVPFCLSLNRTEAIDPARIVARFEATHPRFDLAAFAAQDELASVSGADRIHYCGAYFGFGFHEEAVVSGQAAARAVLASG
ncbi:MAG: FAD-dependent oxidoreductase, partial [Myxococcales bacterium]|nr:FAD-dependent oxidoreductase [Myxococcales bacterium]